jgi:hypothetical protein
MRRWTLCRRLPRLLASPYCGRCRTPVAELCTSANVDFQQRSRRRRSCRLRVPIVADFVTLNSDHRQGLFYRPTNSRFRPSRGKRFDRLKLLFYENKSLLLELAFAPSDVESWFIGPRYVKSEAGAAVAVRTTSVYGKRLRALGRAR